MVLPPGGESKTTLTERKGDWQWPEAHSSSAVGEHHHSQHQRLRSPQRPALTLPIQAPLIKTNPESQSGLDCSEVNSVF